MGELGEALEKCQFRRVWELLAETQMAELVRPFHGFTDAVKAFACHTVAMTYQNIAETTLEVTSPDSNSSFSQTISGVQM